jgi:hypothetical protein
VSAPLDEMIAKAESTRPFKAMHVSVIRQLFDVVAVEPLRIEAWIVNGAEKSWDEVVALLCCAGFASFAAELGSFVVDTQLRAAVLFQLLTLSHYDEVLRFGFDRDMIFDFVVREGLEHATETLVDEHFNLFVHWLKARKNDAAIDRVRATLMKQGRTKEVKRMAERLALQETEL